MRRLAADRKEWRNVTRRSCIIQSNDAVWVEILPGNVYVLVNGDRHT